MTRPPPLSALWLCLHLPDLPLDALDTGPEAALVWQAERGSRRVIAVNHAARALATLIGRDLTSAQALMPQAHAWERQPAREAQRLHHLALALGALTPQIVIEPPDVLLDIHASLRLFNGIRPLLRHALSIGQACGLRVIPGLAATPLAARLLAQARHQHGQPASRVVRLTSTRQRLQSLPLALLGEVQVPEHPLPMAALALLHGLGARHLSDLAALPRAGLHRRGIGAWVDALDRALGQRPDPKPWFTPPVRFEARQDLPWPVDATPTLLTAAEPLLQALGGWLSGRWQAAQAFTLLLRHEHGTRRQLPPDTLRLTLATPSRDITHLRRLLGERLQRLPLSATVDAITLRLDAAVPDAGRPMSWLPDDPTHDATARADLIDRLRARLGPGRILRLSPHADARPERAAHADPIGMPHPPGMAAPRTTLAENSHDCARPSWLLPTPSPLANDRGQPMLAGQRLTLLGRPERIETGWHDGGLARRDYHIAASMDGMLCWIYRERGGPPDEPPKWFLHGMFG